MWLNERQDHYSEGCYPLSRLFKLLVLLAVIGVFGLGLAFGFLMILSGGDPAGFAQTTLLRLSLASRQEELEQPYGTDSAPRRFTINPGDSPLVIARRLSEEQLVRDAALFIDYLRVEGYDTQLEAGTYFLNQTQTIPDIALALTDASSSSLTFRILEGTRIEEVARDIGESGIFAFSGDEFLALVGPGAVVDAGFAARMGLPPGASLEGFLFPDTYVLPPNISAVELRDTILENFEARVGSQFAADAAGKGFTLYQIVTVASIIEREAVHNDEHPMIASVYLNRYAIGMKLDADPTVQYGLQGQRGSWWPQITIADYRGVISPYNTYLSSGLPPGPISNPGLSAIRAALNPATSEYYFFRARCDGSNYHVFAVTYEEHLANGC